MELPGNQARVCSDVPSAMWDVTDVARVLKCSPHHVRRLVQAERMPAPVKLGQLVRWRATELRDWVRAGCPPRSRWTWPQEKGGEST